MVLPGEKAHVRSGKTAKQRGADAVMRLQNLGLVGTSPGQPAPQRTRATVTVAEFWEAVREIRGPQSQEQ